MPNERIVVRVVGPVLESIAFIREYLGISKSSAVRAAINHYARELQARDRAMQAENEAYNSRN